MTRKPLHCLVTITIAQFRELSKTVFQSSMSFPRKPVDSCYICIRTSFYRPIPNDYTPYAVLRLCLMNISAGYIPGNIRYIRKQMRFHQSTRVEDEKKTL